MKYLLLILLFAGCSTKAPITYKSLDLRDSTEVQIQIPSKVLTKLIQAENRTLRTESRQANRTERTSLRQAEKTVRDTTRQANKTLRSSYRKEEVEATASAKKITAIPKTFRYIFLILGLITLLFYRNTFIKSITKLFK